MFFCFFSFFVGLILVVLYNFHYTILLVGLEVLMLGLFVLLCLGGLGSFSFMGVFLFLLVMVCMGGFGVSLLVSLARSYGRDFWGTGVVF
nr:NADH dehydrogenase subunit 4L [Oribatula sakamorii]